METKLSKLLFAWDFHFYLSVGIAPSSTNREAIRMSPMSSRWPMPSWSSCATATSFSTTSFRACTTRWRTREPPRPFRFAPFRPPGAASLPLVAEVTELTERVDNALQVTEDVYLARVYSTALSLFRVPALSASVDRKLAIVRDTYAALYDEASSRRAELLEIAIVVLIIVEIGISLPALEVPASVAAVTLGRPSTSSKLNA